MIIQCEQCNTKFRLDDSKVTDKGVKVRCAKCKHIFTVTKEQEETVPAGDFGTLFDQTAQDRDGTPPVVDSQSAADTPAPGEQEPDFGPAAFGFDETPEPTASMSVPAPEPEQPSAAPADDFDFSSPAEQPAFAADREESTAQPDDIDFGGFDFGDAAPAADETVVASARASFGGEPFAGSEENGEVDFSSESLFGDAVAVPEPEEPGDDIKFDFQMDEFADSMEIDTQGGTTAESGPAETAAGTSEPFSLGEIDFGDELSSVAVQQVNPDELKPAQELLFGQPSQPEEAPVPAMEVAAPTVALETEEPQEELPPLSITSRRKQTPLFMVLVSVIALLVIGVLGYFGYSMFTEVKVKGVADGGRITVRSVDATFIKDAVAGELLVISGEAVNDYKKPRAAIQVKGMVYDGSGKVLTSKTAYCGNPLTKEQLATMPSDKIEAAMANQFGDSLANMGVEPGKALPFTVVIVKPPADAKDYGVEPAGSTVATGK